MVTIVLGVVKCWSGVSYSLVERAHSWRAYSGNQSVDLRDEKCVVVSSVRFFFRSSFDFVPRSNLSLRVQINQIYRSGSTGSRIEFRSGKGGGLQA